MLLRKMVWGRVLGCLMGLVLITAASTAQAVCLTRAQIENNVQITDVRCDEKRCYSKPEIRWETSTAVSSSLIFCNTPEEALKVAIPFVWVYQGLTTVEEVCALLGCDKIEFTETPDRFIWASMYGQNFYEYSINFGKTRYYDPDFRGLTVPRTFCPLGLPINGVPDTDLLLQINGACVLPERPIKPPCNPAMTCCTGSAQAGMSFGNPILPATAEKLLSKTDFSDASPHGLDFSRSYRTKWEIGRASCRERV